MRNDKKGKSGVKRIFNAFVYSVNGIKSAWTDEEAFRQISIMFIIFVPIGAIIGEGWIEKIILITPPFISIMAELINSSIENAVDFTGTKIDPLAKKAKDMGSALQLISLIFWILVWGSYLLSKLF